MIGDRPEHEEVEPIPEIRLGAARREVPKLAELRADGHGEVEGHAGPRKVAEAALVAALVGVHDDRPGRELADLLVVVRDDEIEAEPGRFHRRLVRGDPRVDRHDDLHALGGEGPDGFRVDAVAFVEAVRLVGERVARATGFEE